MSNIVEKRNLEERVEFKEERKKYSYDYWFNDPQLEEWDNGNENYYVNYFYNDIIKKLDIPETGYIVVLGTHLCVSFDKLCKPWSFALSKAILDIIKAENCCEERKSSGTPFKIKRSNPLEKGLYFIKNSLSKIEDSFIKLMASREILKIDSLSFSCLSLTNLE